MRTTDEAQLEVVRLRTPFSIVPDDILTDGRLSLPTRAVLAFLVGRPNGFKIHVWFVRREMGELNGNGKKTPLSPARWRRMRNEMECAGYFFQIQARNPETGRWIWRHQIFDTPQTSIGTKPTDGQPIDGGAIDGKRADKTEDLSARKSKNKKNSSSTAGAAPSPLPHAASVAAAAQEKKRRSRPSGIVTWDSEDESEAARLEEATQPETLAVAIAAITATGKEPLPGRVAREIDRQRRVAKAEVTQAQRREAIRASLPDDPAAIAAGMALLADASKRKNERTKK